MRVGAEELETECASPFGTGGETSSQAGCQAGGGASCGSASPYGALFTSTYGHAGSHDPDTCGSGRHGGAHNNWSKAWNFHGRQARDDRGEARRYDWRQARGDWGEAWSNDRGQARRGWGKARSDDCGQARWDRSWSACGGSEGAGGEDSGAQGWGEGECAAERIDSICG